jgi:hypothetical protein
MATRLTNQRVYDPFIDPDSFGNIALEKHYITKEDLILALEKQNARLPLGEILVECGKLTDTQKEEILMEQERRRCKDRGCQDQLADKELTYQKTMLQRMGQTFANAAVASQGLVIAINEISKLNNR